VALAVAGIATAMVLVLRSGPGLRALSRERAGSTGGAEPARADGPGANGASTADSARVHQPELEPPVTTSAGPPSPVSAAADVERITPGRGGQAPSGTARTRLVIRAKPWAELRVDGKRSGYVQGSRTMRLPAGRHLVELTGPDGVSGAYTVQLVQGHTATLEHPPADH
jgi:hypothetical protein